jgi:hypothetical protein
LAKVMAPGSVRLGVSQLVLVLLEEFESPGPRLAEQA